MGMVISFTRVTAEELDRVTRDPGCAEALVEELEQKPAEPDGYLDQAWADIQELLDAAEVDVELQMDGQPLGDDGMWFGWSKALVKQTAEELRAVPFERLAEYLESAQMTEDDAGHSIGDDPEDIEYVRSYHEVLVEFFKVTAASDSAALMRLDF